jgi:hypothetical protein
MSIQIEEIISLFKGEHLFTPEIKVDEPKDTPNTLSLERLVSLEIFVSKFQERREQVIDQQEFEERDLNEYFVGRLIVVIDVNPSHGFWTARLIKVFGHEGKCTCIYNTHEWIVYIMLFPVVCGTSHGSSWLRRNEFLKMTK